MKKITIKVEAEYTFEVPENTDTEDTGLVFEMFAEYIQSQNMSTETQFYDNAKIINITQEGE